MGNKGTSAWKIFIFSFLGSLLAVSIIFAVFYLVIYPYYNQLMYAALFSNMFEGFPSSI